MRSFLLCAKLRSMKRNPEAERTNEGAEKYAKALSPRTVLDKEWPEPEHYAHWGCPKCGALWTLPFGNEDLAPYCVGSHTEDELGSNYAWPSPDWPEIYPEDHPFPATWVQMVRVKVEAR